MKQEKNKNRFDSSNNNEGDRAQFDFFNTYIGTANSNYDNMCSYGINYPNWRYSIYIFI